MFSLGKKHSQAKIKRDVKTIMDIETKLARASMTRVELRDIKSQYNKRTLKELTRFTPRIDLREYLRLIGANKLRTVIVDQPVFIQEVNRLFKSVSVEKWRIYLYWHLLSGYAGALSDDFVKESFRFNGTVVMGTKKLPPRCNSDRAMHPLSAFIADDDRTARVILFPERQKWTQVP